MTKRERMQKKNIFFQHALYYRSFARIARKLKTKDFVEAESFQARDEIMRIFAAECFRLAQKFRNQKQPKEKLALQYAKLSAKLLGLSLRPKKLSDLDEIKRALAELKAQEKTE